MIHFFRMATAASCITATLLENMIETRAFAATILLQMWAFLEWASNLNDYKLKTYDPVLSDVLPFLMQVTLFIKVINT